MGGAGRLVLRPGNAGSNTAEDQIAALDAALAQLPKRVAAREPILMRADSAGATHKLLEYCRQGRIRFSVGFDLTRVEAHDLGARAGEPRRRAAGAAARVQHPARGGSRARDLTNPVITAIQAVGGEPAVKAHNEFLEHGERLPLAAQSARRYRRLRAG